MQIEETKFEDSIQLSVEGRIDVTAAPQLQNAILMAYQKTNTLILDLDKTAYVSSAGLRAFLIGQKTANSKNGKFKLVNVTNDVKEVLKVTGFSTLLDIE